MASKYKVGKDLRLKHFEDLKFGKFDLKNNLKEVHKMIIRDVNY